MSVLCILTNGFEELEAVGTIALFRRAGIQIDACAISDTKSEWNISELTFSDINILMMLIIKVMMLYFSQEVHIIRNWNKMNM